MVLLPPIRFSGPRGVKMLAWLLFLPFFVWVAGECVCVYLLPDTTSLVSVRNPQPPGTDFPPGMLSNPAFMFALLCKALKLTRSELGLAASHC